MTEAEVLWAILAPLTPLIFLLGVFLLGVFLLGSGDDDYPHCS